MLVDLGIARSHKQEANHDTVHFGTRAYAAPEQYGYQQTDERTDIYGLGALLAFCPLGHYPTETDWRGGFLAEGIPRDLSAIVAKATAFDPEQRHQSARELKEDFEARSPPSHRANTAKRSEAAYRQASALSGTLP